MWENTLIFFLPLKVADVKRSKEVVFVCVYTVLLKCLELSFPEVSSNR